MSEDTLEKNVGMEEDYDDGDSEEESEDVQLGFIEEATNALFGDSDWRNWDGGKVGGNPVSGIIYRKSSASSYLIVTLFRCG